MRGSFRWDISSGLFVLVAAWLAGPGRRAVAARTVLAPPSASAPGRTRARGRTLILLLTGPVGDFARYLSVLVLVALGALWIEWMRGQTLREFPAGSGGLMLDDARARVSTWWDARRAPATAAPAAPATGDVAARLTSLSELHARGELTDAEFAAAKSRVLAGE